MKERLIFALTGLLCAATLSAQTRTVEEYTSRYNTLVKNVGNNGVGVETLLNNWEKDYPDDVSMMEAKFIYYFTKAQCTEAVVMDRDKYLGQKPLVSLKDSLGNPVNYFQVTRYDDELFSEAISYLDKAIRKEHDRLDLRQAKISALIAYENESPDMASSELRSLIDYDASQHPKWNYAGEVVDADYFEAIVQEECYIFFTYGEPACYEAFRSISERMLEYNPKNVLFLDNMGSYYLVCKKDNVTALKYYKKVLKLKSDDYTAIKNIVLLARNAKDEKLEKKYLPLLIEVTEDEAEKLREQGRLDRLNG